MLSLTVSLVHFQANIMTLAKAQSVWTGLTKSWETNITVVTRGDGRMSDGGKQ